MNERHRLLTRLKREARAFMRSHPEEFTAEDFKRLSTFAPLVEILVLGLRSMNTMPMIAFACWKELANYTDAHLKAPEIQANIGQAMVVIRQFAPQAIEADEEEDAEVVDDGPHSSVAEWIK